MSADAARSATLTCSPSRTRTRNAHTQTSKTRIAIMSLWASSNTPLNSHSNHFTCFHSLDQHSPPDYVFFLLLFIANLTERWTIKKIRRPGDTNHTLSKLPAAPLSWMPTKSKQSTKVYVLCLQTYPTEWRVREARSFSNLNAAPTHFLKRQIFVTVAVMPVTRSLIKMSVNIFFTDFTINIKYKIETFILFYCILYNIPLLYSFELTSNSPF